jgi:hypothetical protein
MATLQGYDGRFGLKAWPDARRLGMAHEEVSDDSASLKARARALIDGGAYGCVALSAWSFELNDWIVMETLGPG